MGRNNADFRSWKESDFPSVVTRMSMEKLGEAFTEYGVAAKEVQGSDLATQDSFGTAFSQQDLLADVAANGVKEPIEVQYAAEEAPGYRFAITNGHHRYIAAREAGHTHVPVKITAGSIGGKLPESHELG